MDQELIKNKIKSAVSKEDNVASVILFGSRATGTATNESDWDILVLLDQPTVTFKDEQRIRHKLYDVELEIGEPISTFVYAKEDWFNKQAITPLFKSIQLEGLLL